MRRREDESYRAQVDFYHLYGSFRSQMIERLRASLRRDPWLFLAFAVLWLCALVPIWRPRFLPLLDLPNHIDAIAIWHRFHIASWRYNEFYKLNLLPVPYWGYF